MGLFKRDYSKPGPGVPKNAPRKKGIPRFFEVFARDAGNLFKLNMIYYICILPAISMLVLALVNFIYGNLPMMLLFGGIGLVCSIVVGPANSAMNYILTKMLRDEPGYVFHDFRQVFKKNFKATVIPGIVYSLILGAQVFGMLYYYLFAGVADINIFVVALYLLSVIIFWMASPYFFLQAPYLNIKTGGLLKNSLLMALGYAPRSFMGALFGGGLLVVQVLLLPYSSIITIMAGFSIPALINMMWIWPPVNNLFKIERTLKKRAAGDDYTEEAAEPAAPPPPVYTEDEDWTSIDFSKIGEKEGGKNT